jgi:hypothetical protein
MNHRLKRLQGYIQELFWSLRRLRYHKNLVDVDYSDISIIVVGRNDNYGGEFSLRLKTTLDWNLRQLPGAELIYVEWNKIPERESDCDWIEKRYPGAKCFIVPQSIHETICQNPKMPVMEYFAKNLALRKASRQWLMLINADCFIGDDTVKNIRKLGKEYVYGTHYVSFRWDQKDIAAYHLTTKSNHVLTFPAPKDLGPVVGNFILTHKQNWMNSGGYDEKLNNVRAGVDTNGLNQLINKGLIPMVLGHHFHLDHPESIIHGANQTHGRHAFDNIPYTNDPGWGLINYPLKKMSDRVWLLEKI